MRRRATPPRGYVLIVAYLVTTMLMLWTFVAFQRSLTELRAADRWAVTSSAFQLAEAALDAAIYRIESGTFTSLQTASLSKGTYWADISPTNNPLQYRITSYGGEGTTQRTIDAVAQLTPVSVFQYALFGDQHVDVKGNPIVDSYNSTLGAYDATRRSSNGNVGTNATTPGEVVLSGSGTIYGQILVGKNATNPSSVVIQHGSSATITGSPPITSQSITLSIPSVSVPPGVPCATDLKLNAQQQLTLPAGVYCFKEVKLTGRSTLLTSGAVTVYVTGKLEIGGTSQQGGDDTDDEVADAQNIDPNDAPAVGNDLDPTKLRFLLAPKNGSTMKAKIAGNAQFYGSMYGPQAIVRIKGKAQVFGSVIAREGRLSGKAQIHYDEALRSTTDPTAYYRARVVYWQQTQ